MTGSVIFIVDDDVAVRDSLEILLQSAGHAVRSFASGQEFLDVVSSLAPGCLIVDVRMPGMDGFELQRRLGERQLSIPVIVITGHGDVPMAVRAIREGAVDFIEKPFSERAIFDSIRLALSRLAAHEADSRAAADPAILRRLALLSPREREVLDGLVEGLPNKTIAYDLKISPRTVEIHRARVMDKMQARSLSELVRLALAAGIEPRQG
jgi:two-component system, LuxR family, response regulator FixJ